MTLRIDISRRWRIAVAAGATATVLAAVLLALNSREPARPQQQPAPVAEAEAEVPMTLATAPVEASSAGGRVAFDGVVEALRQTGLAAQVAGAVVGVEVRPGDRVRAGQVVVRLDARAAEQGAVASAAQVDAARATQEAATRDFERQRQLFAQGFISRAALDQAEAQYKAAAAGAQAQIASADAARTQSGFYVVRAPYDGVVAEVPVVQGDMALPGRVLVTVYDPRALRVSAAIPRTAVERLPRGARPEVELPGVLTQPVAPAAVQLLPTVDPATHTQELRLDLPTGLSNLSPGMFARIWLPQDGAAGPARLYLPASAVLRRAELEAVYVIDAAGRPLLRQVRLGRVEGDRVEVLAGVSAGERVALQPQVAARMR